MLSRPRDAVLAAGGCAFTLAAGWALALHVGRGRWLDASVLGGFVGLRRPAVDPAAQALASLGDAIPVTLLGVALVAWALVQDRPRSALAVPVVVAGAGLTAQVLKPLLADPRVCHCLADGRVADASFPSGHATAVMALALSGVLVAPARWRPLAAAVGAALTVATSYALMTMGWHYPSDVLGGFLVAATWALLAVAALRAADARWPARSGRVAAVRLGQALAPTALIAGLAGVAVLGVVALRPAQVAGYLQAHTTFAVGAAALAAAAAALAAGLALALRRF
jgi:membrane-associated phospholipid phosphatase